MKNIETGMRLIEEIKDAFVFPLESIEFYNNLFLIFKIDDEIVELEVPSDFNEFMNLEMVNDYINNELMYRFKKIKGIL